MMRTSQGCAHDGAIEHLTDLVQEHLEAGTTVELEERCDVCVSVVHASVSVWPDGELRGRIWVDEDGLSEGL